MSEWASLKGRVAGKWQVPLFVISVALLGAAVLTLRPGPKEISLDHAVEYLDLLLSGGMFDKALETGTPLLAVEELSEEKLAPIHLRLARAAYGSAQTRGAADCETGRLIRARYTVAQQHALELTPADLEHLGRVSEWCDQAHEAVGYYEQALAGGVDDASELRRHVLQLRQQKLGASAEELDRLLDEFLAQLEDHRLDLRLWALEQKMQVLEELGELEQAATLLARNQARFAAADQQDYFRYLEALLMYKTGHADAAEPHLRAVRNRVAPRSELNAMSGWLLGKVVLSDGGPQRPQEALAFFDDVIHNHLSGPYVVASQLGRAEALAMLQRHADARAAYRDAINGLAELDDFSLVNKDALRVSLAVQAQTQGGDLRAALGYAELAVLLLDEDQAEQTSILLQQLGDLQAGLADQLHAEAEDAREAASARELAEAAELGALEETTGAASVGQTERLLAEAEGYYAAAATTFLRLARLNTLNEERSAEASWHAAELMTRAGLRDRAVRLFRQFAQERPENPLVPRALLRVGQLQQALGHLPQAIEAYQECHERFPHQLDGARALIPLAHCYFALGPEEDEMAEKTLRVVLDDSDVFTPQAPEFADALFLMGDVLNRRGEYERAISVLEEALQRYPDDPRRPRARFVLADSYRQSALTLKDEQTEARFAGEIEYIRRESARRFSLARELYRSLIDEYELRPRDSLNDLERLYYRHACLYEADCYFENRQYRQALKLYEEAAATFKDSTAGLAAYVQIVNCHVFLGQPAEARATLARAQILVDSIPEPAFTQSLSPENRDDWKRFFDWLAESDFAWNK